jgi:hypothetical protein
MKGACLELSIHSLMLIRPTIKELDSRVLIRHGDENAHVNFLFLQVGRDKE